GLLQGVGELGVAVTGEGGRVVQRREQPADLLAELLRLRDGRVAPGALGGVGDAAELGDHHGRVRVHVLGGVVDRASSLRPAPGDRLRGRLLVGVVGGEAVGVGGVVVQGDDVAAGELVAVVGDDGPAGVQGA